MKTLQEWKDVITKHGVECKIDETVGSHPCLVVVIDEPNDYWIDSYSDSGWAVLIARVTAHAVCPVATYVTLGGETYLVVPTGNLDVGAERMVVSFYIEGHGPTKLDALYDALTRKEPQP